MKIKSLFLILFILCMTFAMKGYANYGQKPIVVVIPSYNNIMWYEWNLSSVLSQNYKNFRIIYINDCSKDGTGSAVESFLIKKKIDFVKIDFDDSFSDNIDDVTELFCHLVTEKKRSFILVNNKNRAGALANQYRAIYSCKDEEIVATVDGDDALYRQDVLSELNKVYSSGKVWLTHGKLIEKPSGSTAWCIPIPKEIVESNAFREYRCPSHLRTFYAWLFKKIKQEDLLYNGKFFTMTCDMAMMFPMIEMAGERHAFIDKPNYIYNMQNPINDNKIDAQLQRDLDALIRSKERYQRLK